MTAKLFLEAKSILNRDEWTILMKIVCILVFAFILIFTSIAWEFPDSMFIYGRF